MGRCRVAAEVPSRLFVVPDRGVRVVAEDVGDDGRGSGRDQVLQRPVACGADGDAVVMQFQDEGLPVQMPAWPGAGEQPGARRSGEGPVDAVLGEVLPQHSCDDFGDRAGGAREPQGHRRAGVHGFAGQAHDLGDCGGVDKDEQAGDPQVQRQANS